MTTNAEFNKLFWHSRRGMLELDLLLVPFLQEAYKNLSKADQSCYQKLLECEDVDIFQWVMKQSKPEDADLQHIVQIILNRVEAQYRRE